MPAGGNRRDQYGPSEDDRAWNPWAAPQAVQSYNVDAPGGEGSCHHVDVEPVRGIFGEIVAYLCLVCHTQLPANWQPQPAPGPWAVAAFVLGVLGVIPGAIGCGVVALSRIRRSRRGVPSGHRDTMLAIAGLIAAGVYVVLASLAVAAVLTGQSADARRAEASAGPAEQSRGVPPSAVSMSDLRVGDCVLGWPASDEPFQKVPCQQSHGFEVYAVFHLPGEEWPGEEAAGAAVESECAKRFAEYVGVPHDQSALSYTSLSPGDKYTWGQDPSTICFILPNGRSLTGSVKGTGM